MYRLLYLLFLSTVYAVEKKEIKDPEEKIVSFKKYGLQFTDEVAFSNPQSLNYEDAVDDEEATFGDAYDENLGLLPQYMLHRHGIDKGWVHVPIFPKKGISWSTTPLPAALNDNREWGFTTRLPPEPPVISSDWDRAAETELRKDPSDNYFNGWRRTDQESTPPPWHPPATVRWILVPSTTEEPITTTTTTPETAPPTPEPEPSPMRETGPSNFEHLPRVTPGLDGFQSRETFASQSQTAPTQSPVQEPSAPVFSVNNNFFQPTATQETTTEPTTTEGTTVPAWVTRRRLFFNTFPTTIPPWVTRQHRLFFTTTPATTTYRREPSTVGQFMNVRNFFPLKFTEPPRTYTPAPTTRYQPSVSQYRSLPKVYRLPNTYLVRTSPEERTTPAPAWTPELTTEAHTTRTYYRHDGSYHNILQAQQRRYYQFSNNINTVWGMRRGNTAAPKPMIIRPPGQYHGPTFNCRILNPATDGVASPQHDHSCPMSLPGIPLDNSCTCYYVVSERDSEGCAMGFKYACRRRYAHSIKV